MSNPSPYYKRAPVVEKVLAAQFAPIRGLGTGHLGLFLNSLGAGWASAGEGDPVGQMVRLADHSGAFAEPLVLHGSLRRLRFRDPSGTRLLQVENGWFVHNWRRGSDSEYPRFDRLLPEFHHYLATWNNFVKAQGLGEVQINLWEVCYVNAIRRDSVWKTPSDWSTVFPALFPAPKLSHVGPPLTGALRWTFPLLECDGTLEITFDHVHDADGKDEALRMNQTARGRIVNSAELDRALRIGHDAIIRTFDVAASDAAKEHWGRIS